jgi:hypothetical protein
MAIEQPLEDFNYEVNTEEQLAEINDDLDPIVFAAARPASHFLPLPEGHESWDQARSGPCVAYACCLAMRATNCADRNVTNVWYDPEEFFTRCKKYDGINSDSTNFKGATAAMKQGFVSKDAKGHKTGILRNEGIRKAKALRAVKMDSYSEDSGINGIKDRLRSGVAVPMTTRWPKEWNNPGKNLKTPPVLPSKGLTFGKNGHGIAIVGYNNAKQSFLVHNSWGSWWGYNGLAYIPYEMFKYRPGTLYSRPGDSMFAFIDLLFIQDIKQ